MIIGICMWISHALHSSYVTTRCYTHFTDFTVVCLFCSFGDKVFLCCPGWLWTPGLQGSCCLLASGAAGDVVVHHCTSHAIVFMVEKGRAEGWAESLSCRLLLVERRASQRLPGPSSDFLCVNRTGLHCPRGFCLLWFLKISFFEMRLTKPKGNHFSVCCSLAVGAFTSLCTCHCDLISEQFCSPQMKSGAH